MGDPNNPSVLSPSPRSFIGILYPLTWDHTNEGCIYVGNSQAGPAEEFDGSVIEGSYTNYILRSLFATDYEFAKIQGTCST